MAADQVSAEDVTDVWGARHETLSLPAGTVVVSSAQPHRRLLHAALGFDPHMSDAFLLEERTELENDRGSRIYDITAWNLPMAFGLEAYTAERVGRVAAADPEDRPEVSDVVPGEAAFGYLIPFDDADVYTLLVRLLERGAKPRVARKPFTLAERAFRRGAVLLRRNENPDDLADHLRAAAEGLTVEVLAADTALSDAGPDLGGGEFDLLEPPRVAIASQWPISSTSFGATWYLLDDRLGLRVSPINVQMLGFMDLRKYNVLVIPSAFSLGRVLGEGGYRRLHSWVESGGTLIAMGGSAAALARKESGLSSVRRRRDVLDELGVYEAYVEREIAARSVSVDPATVWEGAPPEPEPAEQGEAPKRADEKTLKREDEWARRFSPQGAVVTATLDGAQWLCFGLDDRLPVLISGSTALASRPPVRTPVRLDEGPSLRLSGLLWPEARARLGHAAYATVERMGNGQVILIAADPFFRGYWEGTGRVLLNAVILGPGMGTSPPLPW